MKKFIIEDLFDVAEAMYDEIVENKKEEVMFVGHYEDAIEVVKELLMYEDVVPFSIELQPDFIAGYTKEYYVSLNEDLELWCEPAWYEEKEFYLMTDTDVAFIADDCNSSILKTIFTNETVEVSFNEDECCDDCCGECICHCGCNEEHELQSDNSVTTRVAVDEDGNIRGFEKTWTTEEDGLYYYSQYKHYSNNEELLHKLMENFNIKIK
jgi:hypothetical protein